MLRNVVRLTHTLGRCSFGTYGMICSIPSQVVVWDFFHQQYVLNILKIWTWTPGPKRDVWFQCFVVLVKHKICFQNIRISKKMSKLEKQFVFCNKKPCGCWCWFLVFVLLIGMVWPSKKRRYFMQIYRMMLIRHPWIMRDGLLQQCQDEYVGGTFGPAFKGGEVAS